MQKDFDQWNNLKKNINSRILPKEFFFHEREVWWASLGLNIGFEEDGKNINFERPVLVLRVFSKNVLLILPLTSKDKINEKNKKFYFKLTEKDFDKEIDSVVILSQIKLIGSERLLRKIGQISKNDFRDIVEKTKDLFPKV